MALYNNFLDAMADSSVAYVPSYYQTGNKVWEAVSPYGEIREFSTHAEANEWRIAECREAAGVTPESARTIISQTAREVVRIAARRETAAFWAKVSADRPQHTHTGFEVGAL